jgi:Ca2+-binding EF-hand superfamily protein
MRTSVNKSQSGAKVPVSVLKGSNQKAKKEVPTAWRDRIAPEDYEQLRDVFLVFDEDGSGIIDPQEIVKVL